MKRQYSRAPDHDQKQSARTLIEFEDRHNCAPATHVYDAQKLGHLGFLLEGSRTHDPNTLRMIYHPKNLDRGLPYINNFIFVPAEQDTKVERVRTFLSTSQS